MNDVTTRNGSAFDPSAVLHEIIDSWEASSDKEAPAEIDDTPSRPDDWNGETFTLVELIDHEASGYRAWGNSVGDFLARQMDELAQLVRWTQATTPDEYEARKEVWDDQIRSDWESRGYAMGRESCPCRQNPFD